MRCFTSASGGKPCFTLIEHHSGDNQSPYPRQPRGFAHDRSQSRQLGPCSRCARCARVDLPLERLVRAFAGQALVDMGAVISALLLHLGDRTGLT
jgi:hypothetical protein